MGRLVLLSMAIGGLFCFSTDSLADGAFLFKWDKTADIDEPEQKAIIFHHAGREDMVIQVKYEGPAEEFGWLIPVPSYPEVRKGSMDCFYELSKLSQLAIRRDFSFSNRMPGRRGPDSVEVLQVQTVGTYDLTVLAADDATKLEDWLKTNAFVFPRSLRNVLGGYIKKKWYFVLVRIDLAHGGNRHGEGGIANASGATPDNPNLGKSKVTSAELHPLVLSFRSDKCVFPLAISAANHKISEVSLYVLSPQPLMNEMIFDKDFAEFLSTRARAAQDIDPHEMWLRSFAARGRLSGTLAAAGMLDQKPNDGRFGLPAITMMGLESPVETLHVAPSLLVECAKEFPGLAGTNWWLTKQVRLFMPEEMRDLEFEPEIPLLVSKLGAKSGGVAAECLRRCGSQIIPALLASLQSSNVMVRRPAAWALSELEDSRVQKLVPALMSDPDARVRLSGCFAAEANWDPGFAPRVKELLNDDDACVRVAAANLWLGHPKD